jgi:hypothetical protein
MVLLTLLSGLLFAALPGFVAAARGEGPFVVIAAGLAGLAILVSIWFAYVATLSVEPPTFLASIRWSLPLVVLAWVGAFVAILTKRSRATNRH